MTASGGGAGASVDGRSLRCNFAAHVVEGGLFIGGMALVHPHTVLPRVLEQLGAPSLVVAFAPVLMNIGYILPGLFVAHRIEQLEAMRGWVLGLGVWQRVPYLLAALMLLAAGHYPALALPAVLLAPLVSGLIGGIAVNAWKEYVASAIPERLRASLWALRYVLGTLLGFVAGSVVKELLEQQPGAKGYAWLHLGTFVCLALSLLVFALTHERARPARPAAQSLSQLIRGVPSLVRADRRFFLYLWARIPVHGVFVLLPFLGIHALGVLGKPDAYLGTLLTFHMLGSLGGYLLAGFSGDRYGGRVATVAAHFGWLTAALATPFAATPAGFQGIFLVLGASLSMSSVGLSTLDLEITPPERRVTFQAVLGVFTLLALVGASLVSALVRKLTSDIAALCIPAGALTLVSLALFCFIEEPRARRRRPAGG